MDNLQTQINNLKTLQESYDAIAGAAEAYNTGKVELAANITSKGVQASASETLPELAAKVGDIQQRTIEIDGGDMYAAQLTGDGTLWNLYEVLADMKSRFMGTDQYACLIVCEYYKGYDSLQLQGADAYYTCDGDFYNVSSPLHTWHDSDNGKVNRWVCFLFATEGARLDITNTAISPRSMYIGGHIGTIEYFVNGRLTDLVGGVEETDIVDYFLSQGYTQEWGFNCIIRGVKHMAPSEQNINTTISSGGMVELGLEGEVWSANVYMDYRHLAIPNAVSVYFTEATALLGEYGFLRSSTKLNQIIAPKATAVRTDIYGNTSAEIANSSPIEVLYFPSLTQGNFNCTSAKLIDVVVGAVGGNLSIKGWNPTTVLADTTKKAQLIENIKNHILARVSDRTDSSQLVFTISTNMYNAIASETITWNDQTMTLADAFLTKNWLLAGA